MIPGPIIIRECSSCEKKIAQSTLRSGNSFGSRRWTDGKVAAPMLTRYPKLVKCPHCNSYIWINEQPQVGEVDSMVRGIRWITKRQGQNARNDKSSDIESFEDSKFSLNLTLHDYEDYLGNHTTNTKKEKYVRISAWWLGNDQRRTLSKPNQMTSSEFQQIHGLLKILEPEGVNELLGELPRALVNSDPLNENGKTIPLSAFEIKNLKGLLSLLDGETEDERIMKAEILRELGEFVEAEILLSEQYRKDHFKVVVFIRDLNGKKLSHVEEMVFD